MKKKKRVSMITKVSTKNVSSTEYQRIEKEQKQNSNIGRVECREKIRTTTKQEKKQNPEKQIQLITQIKQLAPRP